MAAASSPGSPADWNLLLGIIAVQRDFVTRAQWLAGMKAWIADKARSLDQILVEHKVLSVDQRAALLDAAKKHLANHDGNQQESLRALSHDLTRLDFQQLDDQDIHECLAQVLGKSAGRANEGPREPTTLGLPTEKGARFSILRPHAKGGIGQVYVAHDVELNREVALKEILEHSADNPAARARFLLEAEITGGLEHPGIVPVYAVGNYRDGRPYYAMRFIRGDSLRTAIARLHGSDRQGASDPTTAAAAKLARLATSAYQSVAFRQLLGRFIDVCNAVAYAHSRGVLHRDLKPGNIMLGKYGETLVVDWGLAKVVDWRLTKPGINGPDTPPGAVDVADTLEEKPLRTATGSGSSETVAGSAIGSPAFMSPEQAAGRLDLQSPASDIYSLGATLYVLLTGVLPFPGTDTGEVLQQVQRGEFVAPRRVNANVPPPLEAICLKAMSLRPADRYASALALATELEHWLADEPVAAHREPLRVRVGRWIRRHKAQFSGAAATLIVSLIATGMGIVLQQIGQARHNAEAMVREADAARKRGQAEQAVREALDHAENARGELHAVLQKPGGVFTLLNEPARWHSLVQSAQPAVTRAQALLANADEGIHPELRPRLDLLLGQLRQDDDDRLLAMQLDKIRVDRSTLIEGAYDHASAMREYPKAFAAGKLTILEAPPEALAEAFAASTIKEQLVAAVDDWASVARRIRNVQLMGQLLAVARQADPDPRWRDRFRQTKVWIDPDLLAVLVKEAPTSGMSPQMVAAIGSLLPAEEGHRESWLRAGLAKHPADFWLNLQLGSVLDRSHAVEAAALARTAIALRPNSAVAYNNLGSALVAQKRHLDAASAYERAVELDPKNAALHFNLANNLRHVPGRFEESIPAYEMAIALDPQDFRAMSNLGGVMKKQGRLDAAVELFHRALAIDANQAATHSNLGAILHQQKRLPEALKHLEKAIALDPKHAHAYNNLGIVLSDLGRPKEAAEAHRKAMELEPQLAEAHNNLGTELRRQGRPEEAIAALRRAIEVDPKHAVAYSNLGLVLQEQGRFEEALKACEQAVALNPRLVSGQNHLGMVLDDLGRFDEAVAAYRKALELDSTNADVLYNLGLTFHRSRRLDEAIDSFRKSLAVTPNLPHRQGALGSALLERGLFAEGLAASQKALDLAKPGHPLHKQVLFQRNKCKEALALDARVTEVTERDAPATALQLLGMAKFCADYRERYVTALQLYRRAFQVDAKLVDDLALQSRYLAASAAVLASLGKGAQADSLSETERGEWRRQALAWLLADLNVYLRQLKSGKLDFALQAEDRLSRWQTDRNWTALRDSLALEKLPADDRNSWQLLWTGVRDALTQIKSRFKETRIDGILKVKAGAEVHSFAMTARSTYILDLVSTAFDPYLKLEDAKHRILAENDDIDSKNLNARIVFKPLVGGMHRMIVSAFNGRGTGPYSLRVREVLQPFPNP